MVVGSYHGSTVLEGFSCYDGVCTYCCDPSGCTSAMLHVVNRCAVFDTLSPLTSHGVDWG